MHVDFKIAVCEFCVIWAGQDGEVYKENEAKEDDATENESNKLENDKDQEDAGEKKLNKATENMENRKVNRQPHNSVQEDEGEKESGGIPLPWELLQPVLRILVHCLMGRHKNKELYEAACRSLYARSLHDVNSRVVILATGSRLLRLVKMNSDAIEEINHTDTSVTNVISL